jgi:hypothetical protein
MQEPEAKATEAIRVFVGSPNDMAEHRGSVQRAIDELNEGNFVSPPLKYLDWKKDAFPAAGSPQELIFEMIGPHDIFVGIFGHRIGSPTEEAVSGTVAEYEHAHRLFKDHERPEIVIYFHRLYGLPRLGQLDSLRSVLEFKEDLDKKVLAWEYDTPSDLERLARTHLFKAVGRSKGRAEEARARNENYGDEPERLETDAPEVVQPRDVDPGIDLEDLRLTLDAKLAWVTKHLISETGNATFATIGSLQYDGYLPREQARRAARLMAFDPGSVASADPAELRSFARAVDQDVANFRATVFDGYVRKFLKTRQWAIDDFPQTSGHRPDFLATKGGSTFRVAPRLVTSRDSEIRDRAVNRLARTRDEEPTAVRRIVVMPDLSRSPTTGPNADPQVVKLSDLVESLGA